MTRSEESPIRNRLGSSGENARALADPAAAEDAAVSVVLSSLFLVEVEKRGADTGTAPPPPPARTAAAREG